MLTYLSSSIWALPFEVLREALINAIVHRDYFEEGAGILVEVYDDRVEITNPGRLLFDSSKFGKLSVARNPILFDAFHRLGITEKIGSGISRMRQTMAARNIEIDFDTEDFFIVTLARPETTRKESTPQATSQALSNVELRIVRFCHEEKSALEIINFIGMNPDYIRKDIIPKLIEKDFLALTIPDKPRSPHQKYILTETGKEKS